MSVTRGVSQALTSGSRPRAADALAALSPLDRDLLDLVTAQRVLSAHQFERLFPGVPPRTLRYRTARLVRLGLLGRTRPYRASGSAPFYYWPTRATDAFRRGAPPRQGGERAAPNPAFLAHAAGISGLYVELVRGKVQGLRLVRFYREAEAREALEGREPSRAIAPDIRLELEDAAGRALLAHVELDRGTMGHPRLRAKAAGYIAYAHQRAWAGRHPFSPALLFLTTTAAGTLSFLEGLAAMGRRDGEFRSGSWSTAAACAQADDPERALTEACWHDVVGRSEITFFFTRGAPPMPRRRRSSRRSWTTSSSSTAAGRGS